MQLRRLERKHPGDRRPAERRDDYRSIYDQQPTRSGNANVNGGSAVGSITQNYNTAVSARRTRQRRRATPSPAGTRTCRSVERLYAHHDAGTEHHAVREVDRQQLHDHVSIQTADQRSHRSRRTTARRSPNRPTRRRRGYTFTGWYSDAGLTSAYTFTTMPGQNNITLYAKSGRSTRTRSTLTRTADRRSHRSRAGTTQRRSVRRRIRRRRVIRSPAGTPMPD
ncbi:MAG: InlB B-repeat-containing protein [Bacillus subtilis]|nr:InlB B-repeat-containing protein [Bacillus subtilis]